MSDTQGWYARKLAQMRGQQQQQPTPAPARGWAPQQQQPQRMPQQVPGYQQPQPQYQTFTPSDTPQRGETTIENFAEMMAYWKGGDGHKHAMQCPRCGSGNFFSHQTTRRGPPPAPRCYNCGYNDGLFTQGDAAAWGASA